METKILNEAEASNLLQGAVIRWVAVTEQEPPLYAGDLLICWKDKVRVGWYQNHTKLWWFSVTDAVDRGVTHWAEMPKPPCV